MCTCGACQIPERNLTLSWTNPISGPGSTTLNFQSCILWNTPCVNQNQYKLECAGGVLKFTVTYQLSGACPGGLQSTCVTSGTAGHKLDPGTPACGAGFLWAITVNGTDCPALFTSGFTSFTISA
jgi:hypothetical protein